MRPVNLLLRKILAKSSLDSMHMMCYTVTSMT